MPVRSAVRSRITRATDQLAMASEPEQVDASPAFAMAAFFVGWLAIGFGLAWLLVRRGHDPKVMGTLAMGLGPLLLAVVADRSDEQRVPTRLVRRGVRRAGGLDVLIVLDRESSAVRELDATLHSLHGDLRRTTIVTTVPYECLDPDPLNRALPAAATRLREAAELMAPLEPELVVLAGHPDRAPRRFADAERYGLTLYARH